MSHLHVCVSDSRCIVCGTRCGRCRGGPGRREIVLPAAAVGVLVVGEMPLRGGGGGRFVPGGQQERGVVRGVAVRGGGVVAGVFVRREVVLFFAFLAQSLSLAPLSTSILEPHLG
ncbi:hypothetical protein TNCT_382131 [Trichonephila clavata]|uniref:Uncharacterized protein n=1 Tax=Trichonephila clavata TaxID=2740835 RepID=A0A8X6GRB8_TRICU|nr:hypothetical protein TNCT_382131 [Trichonephila clavata]